MRLTVFNSWDVDGLGCLMTPAFTNDQLTTEAPGVDLCVSVCARSVNVLYKR